MRTASRQPARKRWRGWRTAESADRDRRFDRTPAVRGLPLARAGHGVTRAEPRAEPCRTLGGARNIVAQPNVPDAFVKPDLFVTPLRSLRCLGQLHRHAVLFRASSGRRHAAERRRVRRARTVSTCAVSWPRPALHPAPRLSGSACGVQASADPRRTPADRPACAWRGQDGQLHAEGVRCTGVSGKSAGVLDLTVDAAASSATGRAGRPRVRPVHRWPDAAAPHAAGPRAG